MLTLTDICKTYRAGDTEVQALASVSISFRKSEFVSVLGPSGCGKTTLLNIIGGLDRYTEGQLCVDGIPTSEFKDHDWDSYRNHSIGFVFQSYNLIPHQTVLANVELALTLSGVSKSERRRRAEEALRKVGLGDQLKKKPNQMSGGQMQRVAIARALVNDPDILLADEPTGALDSETSVQIMEILREIAEDKLIIMVTHNPDLAEEYSSRIIRLLDGRVISDSNPYHGEQSEENGENAPAPVQKKKEKFTKTQMSFFAALSLSTNNLLTKKGRTTLTAFAGSIGIIGIALILSLSNGINLYIEKVQEDTLSTYPITIQEETVDMAALLESMLGVQQSATEHEEGKVYSSTLMYDLMDAMLSADVHANNLTDFRAFIEGEESGFRDHVTSITYQYGVPPTIYAADTSDQLTKVNPPDLFSDMMSQGSVAADSGVSSMSPLLSTSSTMNIWSEMIDNRDLMSEQYDVVSGRWPDAYNEVVLVIDENNEINDVYLYALGLKDPEDLRAMMQAVMKGEPFHTESTAWTYEELLALEFKLTLPTDAYRRTENGTWTYMGDNEAYMKQVVDQAESIRVVGIIRPSESAVATSLQGAVGYTAELTSYIIDKINDSELVKQQLADAATDVLPGLPFDDGSRPTLTVSETATAIRDAIAKMSSAERAAIYTASVAEMSDETAAQIAEEQAAMMPTEQLHMVVRQAMMAQMGMDEASVEGYMATMPQEQVQQYAVVVLAAAAKEQYAAETRESLGTKSTDELSAMMDGLLTALTDDEIAVEFAAYMPALVSEATYEENLALFGYADLTSPTAILIYCDTFESKDMVAQMIEDYNRDCVAQGKDEDVINYTDYVALMMSSISTIINVISYVLIAFVSISLVVSSIMIGIITYISVLERTKEIGILRSIGASKKDISRVFNAETLIIGFTAGAIGIVVTLILDVVANVIIEALTDIPNIARLPVEGAVILILISMALTMIAGLIPSRLAARKDPVIALRTE